ncbi:MAG: hypothetical protein Q7S62_01275 [bacterium]|nr:hypothetical protein [bacterium]
MYSRYYTFKPKAVRLRKAGKTYGEIKKILRESISKSTLSHWFRDIILTKIQQGRLQKRVSINIKRAQIKAWAVNKKRREEYIQNVRDRVRHFPNELRRKKSAKIALAMLYLGEGAKTNGGSLMFGNSDPSVICLFLHLLRYCYDIDEKKFRCTLQCRSDQNIEKLEKFWSRMTQIPPSQFYKARVDPRTIGKPSRNLEYKGVCRIDYFSGEIFIELQQIVEVLYTGR